MSKKKPAPAKPDEPIVIQPTPVDEWSKAPPPSRLAQNMASAISADLSLSEADAAEFVQRAINGDSLLRKVVDSKWGKTDRGG